ncbi:hypothetical protein D3C78_1416320 [compost metagenome]
MLAGAATRRIRLDHLDLVEFLTRILQVNIETFTLKNLDHEITTRLEYPLRQIKRQLTQEHGFGHVHFRRTTHIGGHIGNHKVHLRITHGLKDLSEHLVLGEVTLDESHVRNAVHFQDVRGNQTPLTTDQPTSDLRPATGCCTEVDNTHARTDQLVFLLDLQKLVTRTRAVAILLRLLHIGIIDMSFQPTKACLGTRHWAPR